MRELLRLRDDRAVERLLVALAVLLHPHPTEGPAEVAGTIMIKKTV